MSKNKKRGIIIKKRGQVTLWYACVKSFVVAVKKSLIGILDNQKIKMIIRKVMPKTQTGS